MGENTALVEDLVTPTNQNWQKGEKQPSAFKDVPFAVLFVAHLVAIIYVVAVYGTEAVAKEFNGNTGDVDTDYIGYIYAALSTGVFGFTLSALMMRVMIEYAPLLVKVSLIFSVIMSLVTALLSLFFGSIMGGIFGLLFFAISVCYARMVWPRIPFASANLETSLSAIQENFGITFVSYLFVILAFAWVFFWTLAVIGVYEQTAVCDDETGTCTIGYGYLFFLLVSLYWTQQVIMNTIHVTVSGVLGTWWFVPEEASSCCSSAVTSSLWRSLTYSFGSICFGSLVVALIQALREFAQQARQQGDGNALLLCIVDCILSFVESLVEYFNKWAYVYVGIYGYGYIDAGKNVMGLFRARGWEAIIAEDLVGSVLFLVSLITGLLVGAMGLVVELSTDWFTNAGDASQTVAFFLGFIIGFVLCSIMLNVVASGVTATIVLFAEAPSEFQTNHPELSNQMRIAYAEAYPRLF